MAKAKKTTRTENCPICGRLMNREKLKDGRIILRCKDEPGPWGQQHTTLVYLKVSL